MATYGSLLIDAGGGVIDHNKQSDKEAGATVIIGLGGTGSDAVIRLKREVHRQLKPDNPESAIPKYSNIKYLIIDSDASKINADGGKRKISDIDGATEFLSIANKSIKATFAAREVMKNRRDLDWLDYEHISIADASTGAGGIRQVGRFLLVDKASEVYSKIKSTISGALVGTNELTVHICTGISGGTGSGTFLDVCYMVRAALSELGKGEARVCGYFFLPDVNLSVPEISADSLKSGYVKVNGYAALKELDYCMNFDKNKDSFRMNYGFKKIDDRQRPVDLCYLISTTNAEGTAVSNGYNYAMGVVTDFIISFMAKVDNAKENETEGITLKGHISNLETMKKGIKLQHGANVEYNILGASVAEMPLSEIATYLGFRLFECYRDMFDRTPTERERDDFLQAVQLEYEDIKRALSKGCPQEIAFPSTLDAKKFKSQGNGRFVEFADEEYLAKNKGTLEENSRTFKEKLKDYAVPEDSTSLIARTYKGLYEKYLTRPEYGPFYAQRMLCGNHNKNLIHAVDGFLEQNQANLEAERRQAERRDSDYNEALEKMKAANLMNEKSRMKEYLNALENLYVHLYRVELYETLNDILRSYKDQIIRLNNDLFEVLTTVLDTLQKTFQENGRVLTEGVRTENRYNWKILSVPDVCKSLDEEVRRLDLRQTLDSLMREMMEGCARWISGDENEINRLISDFILKAFRNATQKTITDYLKVKFEVDSPALLQQKIETEIIGKKLEKDSTPLFWRNSMYPEDRCGRNSTLTVPYDSSDIKAAAYEFKSKKGEFAVRESHITDKISMMRFYSGLPMYAYQGILELEGVYEGDTKPGRHLYERGEVDWNKYLPSPVPCSFKVGLPIDRIRRRNEALLAEFEEAERAGVVRQDLQGQGHWEICETEAFDVDRFVAEKGGYETKGKVDIVKLSARIGDLEEKLEALKREAVPRRIESLDANAGSERQVMLDFYLLSPVLNRMLREELERRRAAVGRLEEWKKLKERESGRNSEQKDFFNAIFTGVLFYGNTVTYTYDRFGDERTVVLQNSEMELGDTGAYQAFLTFQSMEDQEVKKRIIADAKKRMNEEDSPEVKEALEKLEANMPKRLQKYRTLHDETDPIHDEMEKFYLDFMKALNVFKLDY